MKLNVLFLINTFVVFVELRDATVMLVDASIRRMRTGDGDRLIILSKEQENVRGIEGWTARLPFGKKED